jgi:hypothetical protein
MMWAKFLTMRERRYKNGKGEGQNKSCGVETELELLVWVMVYNIYKQIQK